MINPRIQRQLETIDWDFLSHLPGTSKAIHWYPGTFPSELPGTLIQALSKPDELILDPYSGIGTTGLEAIRLGRRAWLVEANPVGALVSYVSAALLVLKAVDETLPKIIIQSIRCKVVDSLDVKGLQLSRLLSDDEALKTADKILHRFVDPIPARFITKLLKKEPNWESLDKWYHQTTLEEIKSVWNHIATRDLRNFGTLLAMTMLSAVLRPACSQTQSWGHIADNVWPKALERKNLSRLCLAWLTRTDGIVGKTDVARIDAASEQKRFFVSNYSWGQKRNITAKRPTVNVVVTSPPYAGAIDYTFAQRLSLYMLGYDDDGIKALSSQEIGARRKRFMPASRSAWASEIVGALSQQLVFIGENATLGFVLPHKDAGREAGALAIEKYLFTIGFEKILEVDRSIRQGRTRQSWTSIKKEIVQIYAR
jgi:hypothetical protein